MVPDEWSDARIGDLARHYEGLFASYGALSRDLAVIDQREKDDSARAARERQEIRDAMRENTAALTATLVRFDEECEKKLKRLETDFDEELARLAKIMEGRQWPIGAKIAAVGIFATMVMSALGLIIGGA